MGLTAVQARPADAGGLEIHGRPWPKHLDYDSQAIAKWKQAQKRYNDEQIGACGGLVILFS